MNTTTITRSFALFVALFTPALASAAISLTASFCIGSCTGIEGVAAKILGIINGVLVPLLFAVAFIVFIYGIFKAYILSGGDSEEVKKGHSLVLWGLIGFVVMISLWGMVNVVANTFGLTGYNAPITPTSY